MTGNASAPSGTLPPGTRLVRDQGKEPLLEVLGLMVAVRRWRIEIRIWPEGEVTTDLGEHPDPVRLHPSTDHVTDVVRLDASLLESARSGQGAEPHCGAPSESCGSHLRRLVAWGDLDIGQAARPFARGDLPGFGVIELITHRDDTVGALLFWGVSLVGGGAILLAGLTRDWPRPGVAQALIVVGTLLGTNATIWAIVVPLLSVAVLVLLFRPAPAPPH
jgi:hypothetical protein